MPPQALLSLASWKLCLMLLCTSFGVSAAEVRIGVPLQSSVEQARLNWQATVDYLAEHLPEHHFTILPLDSEGLHQAVEEKRVDFLIANPAIYVELEVRHGATRIATVTGRGDASSRYGAVIFTRADRADIRTLDDLTGTVFQAVDSDSFGGWLMARHELARHGIEPYDFKTLRYSAYPMDRVVQAVLAGEADAGTVRTGLLESLAAEGRIRLADLRVLNPRGEPGFPFLLSTPLYPEHALARLPHADNELARRMTAQLLLMSEESPAARSLDIAGWTTPLNYEPVHQVLRDLKVPPYEHYGEIDFMDAVRQHWAITLSFAILLLALSASSLTTLRLTARLRGQAAELETRVRERTRALANSEERLRLYFEHHIAGMAITTPEMGWLLFNDALCRMLGYTHEELAGITWTELTHPEDLRADKTKFESLLAGQIHDYALEKRFIRKDGRVLWTHLSVGCARRVDGSVDYVLALLLDIGARKQAEDAARAALAEAETARHDLLIALRDEHTALAELQLAKERLERAEESAHLGHWSLETESGRGYWSRQMFRLFNLAPADDAPAQDDLLAMIHPDDRAMLFDTMERMKRGLQPEARIYRTNPSWGAQRYLFPTWRVHRSAEGQALRYEGTLQDVTDIKEAELALEKQLAELRQWHRVTLDREGRVLELKDEINALLAQQGLPPRYGPETKTGGSA